MLIRAPSGLPGSAHTMATRLTAVLLTDLGVLSLKKSASVASLMTPLYVASNRASALSDRFDSVVAVLIVSLPWVSATGARAWPRLGSVGFPLLYWVSTVSR